MSNVNEYSHLTPVQLAMVQSLAHDDKTSVIDADEPFTVDVKNKVILSPDKKKLVQFSHNSERVTFDCDRYIEGHDITLCNVVQIHYLDDGIYDIDDLTVSEDDETKVTFTWLISGNATEEVVSSVPFSLVLECTQEDGTCTYSWETEENTSIYVVKSRRNSQNVAYQYADVLAQWKADVLAATGANITIDPALSDTSTNPVQNKAVTAKLNELNLNKISIPSTGTVDQVLAVKSVDENGKPSEFQCVDVASGGSVIERVEMLQADTTVTIEPNKLYVFPEMESLTYTLAAGDVSQAEEYHFIFTSGATATEVVHPAGVNIGSFQVDANKVYEVSIMENLLTSQSWAVSG